MYYVGMDVAKEKHYICVLDEAKKLACKPFWIYSDCLDFKVLLLNFYKTAKYRDSTTLKKIKNDSIDAYVIA